MGGEDDDPGLGPGLEDVLGGVDAILAGQLDVDDADIGLQLPDDVDDLLTDYAEELKATDQGDEAVRILDLAANAPENFLMVVPNKVQADPSISTE